MQALSERRIPADRLPSNWETMQKKQRTRWAKRMRRNGDLDVTPRVTSKELSPQGPLTRGRRGGNAKKCGSRASASDCPLCEEVRTPPSEGEVGEQTAGPEVDSDPDPGPQSSDDEGASTDLEHSGCPSYPPPDSWRSCSSSEEVPLEDGERIPAWKSRHCQKAHNRAESGSDDPGDHPDIAVTNPWALLDDQHFVWQEGCEGTMPRRCFTSLRPYHQGQTPNA